MILVQHATSEPATDLVIAVPVDRLTLAKRRWRANAADGREFGFDLERHLHDGDVVHSDGGVVYVVAQSPEPVLEVALSADPAAATTLAWQIGNLHFPIQVMPDVIRVSDDSAIRQMLDREHVAYTACLTVFRPISAAHGHHHHH
jgi:urease accessory protein